MKNFELKPENLEKSIEAIKINSMYCLLPLNINKYLLLFV